MPKNDSTELPFDIAYFEKNKTILPVVRIAKVEIDGFKSVEHGEIVLDCGKQFIPYGTQSDILGVYGQNGSGKTSLIESLSILKMAMSGASISPSYSDCISIKRSFSTLTFTFDLQYPNDEIRTVEYMFSIRKVKMSRDEIRQRWEETHGADSGVVDDSIYESDDKYYRVQVFDETVKLLRNEKGNKTRLQTIIDTSGDYIPFGPNKKIQELVGTNRDAKTELKIYRNNIYNESKSFVFNDKVLEIFIKCNLAPVYFETLLALRYYARRYLFVVDTKPSGIIGLKLGLPLYTRFEKLISPPFQERVSVDLFNHFSKKYSNISIVLSQLIPGLSIKLKKISDTVMKNGEPGVIAIPMACRDDKEIPLRDESDGVRKIISVLGLIIAAYNDMSTTIAIDEFDAGVFEYLLGEILQSFEESGKGQFIFTSHNLRPLEVIDKKYIVFTTTNENNRYYRFKDISSTNNLRDSYFREIILGGQEESLYNKTKRFKIEYAMKKANEDEE